MKPTFVTKTDLAQAYFPFIDACSARHKLMHFINSDEGLLQALHERGYRDLQHTFSPLQMALIFERLGNPFA